MITFFTEASSIEKDGLEVVFPIILIKALCYLCQSPDADMVPAGSLQSLCYTKWNCALIHLFNYICTYRQFLVNDVTEKKVYKEVVMQIEKYVV